MFPPYLFSVVKYDSCFFYLLWWKILVFLSPSLGNLILPLWTHMDSSVFWICSSCMERWERWFISIVLSWRVSLIAWKFWIDERTCRLLETTLAKLCLLQFLRKESRERSFKTNLPTRVTHSDNKTGPELSTSLSNWALGHLVQELEAVS